MAEQIAGQLAYRARPWLKARMPAFGPYGESLATGLASNHGLGHESLVNDIWTAQRRASAKLGERLTEREGGLDCRLCHALGGEDLRLDNRAQGIGLSLISQRLRPEYYERWMHDPLRIDPQTAMPRFSADGVTTKVTEVLDGDARQQFQAIWEYLEQLGEQPAH
jgi:hypothetical protein